MQKSKLNVLILGVFVLLGVLPSGIERVGAQELTNPAGGSILYLPTMMTPPKYTPIINAPHFNGVIPLGETAIAWFGNISPSENYADIRIGYNDESLLVHLLIFDKRLWFDKTPTEQTLTEWDAASLYLNLDGNTGNHPGTNAYSFTGQLTWALPGEDSKSTSQGNGSDWILSSIPFELSNNWRGNAPNDDVDDRGWWISFEVPFTSINLAGPPVEGTIWGMSVRLYDRDDSPGTAIPIQSWPQDADPQTPATWGQLRFGLPDYTPPPASTQYTIQIRHGLNGNTVIDGHVGGQFTCGAPFLSDLFGAWGNANYAGDHQIDIQNQGDVADWPCFSKFLVTFPLDNIPPGKVILSAQLTLNEFGNSGQGQPNPIPDSFIQVLTAQTGWNENTLTWNNTPYAWENFGGTTVSPVEPPGSGPYPWDWDISRAVAGAYDQNIPLRLVLYSADLGQHSGKYFVSSDAGPAVASLRPTLTVTYGD